MKFKIISDSSCDLTKNYFSDQGIDIPFSVIPLTINVDDKQYVDDENINIEAMLKHMYAFSGKATTACPAPGVFMKEFEEAEYSFCITISKKLSGTYNSAMLAKNNLDKKDNIHIIDSKGTCGSLVLIIDELARLIQKGLSFHEICEKIDEFTEQIELLFVLDKFDNLVKNGRMSRLSSVFATALRIKPLCQAYEGEIKVIEKVRTIKAALKRLVSTIETFKMDLSEKTCVISHCFDEETALEVKSMIEEKYNFKEIKLFQMRGLCSFYALNKGIIVCL